MARDKIKVRVEKYKGGKIFSVIPIVKTTLSFVLCRYIYKPIKYKESERIKG